jgi:hypothetical protein
MALIWKVELIMYLFMKKNSKKHLRNIFKITLKFLTRPVVPHITVRKKKKSKKNPPSYYIIFICVCKTQGNGFEFVSDRMRIYFVIRLRIRNFDGQDKKVRV